MSEFVTLSLFGGFVLKSSGGAILSLRLRKSEALLSYLACQPARQASREQVANLLWGDYAQPRARQSLRQALLDLKQAFESHGLNPLKIGRDIISLDRSVFFSDVEKFQTLIAKGSAEALSQAVDLYQGEFLAGFSIRSSDFDGWLLAHRNRFQDMLCQAAVAYIDMTSEVAPEKAIEVGKRTLDQDPAREELHRALIELYGRSGLKSAAMAQFRQCKAALERELGIGPDEETVRLIERIAPNVEDERPGVQSQTPRISSPSSLQLQTSSDTESVLIGRQREREALEEEYAALSGGPARTVVIRGDGGVGKSLLLLSMVEAYKDRSVLLRVGEEDPRADRLWLELSETLLIVANDDSDRPADDVLETAVATLRRELSTAVVEIGSESLRRFSNEALTAATALLRVLARRNPLILAFEGLHMLPRKELEEVWLWLRRVESYPLLTLMAAPAATFKSFPAFEEGIAKLMSAGRSSALELQPLSDDMTETLCRNLQKRLDLDVLKPLQMERIVRVSEGNPKAAITFVMDLVGRGGRFPEQRTYLPAQIQNEIDAWVSQVGDKGRELLFVAAVCGGSVPVDVLMKSTGLPLAELAENLEEVSRLHIAEADEQRFEIRFRRVRYGILNRLSAHRRRALHRAVADAYRELDCHSQVLCSAEIASHLKGAGDERKAAAFQLRAADLAMRRGELSEAENLFDEVLTPLFSGSGLEGAAPSPVALHARLGLSQIAEWRLDFGTALEISGAVVQASSGQKLRATKASAEITRARALFVLGDRHSAIRAARRANNLAEGWDGAGGWLMPDVYLAWTEDYRDGDDRVVKSVTRALNEAKAAGLVLDEVETLIVLAVLHLRSSPREAASHIVEATELAVTLGNPRYDAMLSFYAGLAAMASGDLAVAESALLRAKEETDRVGDLYRRYLVRGYMGLLSIRQGRLFEGMDQLRASLYQAATLGCTLGCQDFSVELARLQAKDPEAKTSRRLLEGALSNATWANEAGGHRLAAELKAV